MKKDGPRPIHINGKLMCIRGSFRFYRVHWTHPPYNGNYIEVWQGDPEVDGAEADHIMTLDENSIPDLIAGLTMCRNNT